MRVSPPLTSREWLHALPDGTQLFLRSSSPAPDSVRGGILLTHGMGEHSGRYTHVVERLNAAGFRVLTWDLRGHGRSQGRRGDIRNYDVLLEDLLAVWSIARSEPGPVFLYGHSLGGQITLNFAVRHRPETAGLIVTSPWLRLAFTPPRWKLILASITARVWPSFSQDTEVVANRLSRDLEFLQAMPDLDLIHHRMSARMFRALTTGASRASLDAAQIHCPILILQGSNDPITSVEATREFFQSLQARDKSLVIVPDALHEPHNDLCRDAVLDQITAWAVARLSRDASS